MLARVGPMALVGAAVLAAIVLPPPTESPATPQTGQQRQRPTGPVSPDQCAACHGETLDFDTLHGPVSVGACAACHRLDSVEEHRYSLVREGAALCTYCHDVKLSGTIHTPLTEGDCTGCHDPHGGPDRQMLKAPTLDELCKSCHHDVTGAARHVHGPAAVGACSVCHLPHASPHAGLLRSPPTELCMECHVSAKIQFDTLRHHHQPFEEDCLACHDPHASDQPMLLHREPQMLCMECHDEIRHTVETAATQHAAVTSERQCLNCHSPHASDYPRLLLTEMQTLCFECHDRDIKMPDGSMMASIKSVIESGTSLHGPVAQHNCSACHMIHGGDHFRMLVQEYPAEFYAPFAEELYALCFSCHERHLVLDANTTTLTDFRNGDVNLHYVHVNRDRKGRTCRACHETHASNYEKHIRESVPFGPGGWKLPIGFEKTATGGSCAPGCHSPYAYDRDNPVMYEKDGKPAIWPAPPGKSPDE